MPGFPVPNVDLCAVGGGDGAPLEEIQGLIPIKDDQGNVIGELGWVDGELLLRRTDSTPGWTSHLMLDPSTAQIMAGASEVPGSFAILTVGDAGIVTFFVDDGAGNSTSVAILPSGMTVNGAPVPAPFKVSAPDTADRDIISTGALVPFPGIGTHTFLGLEVGWVVELDLDGEVVQSGASGATTGIAGFIVDRPISADLERRRARCDSAVQEIFGFSDKYVVTEPGTHTFKVAGASGNGAALRLVGSAIPTIFTAKVLGFPAA